MLIRKLNLKGQLGETLTWVVATILIVILLIFFIFGPGMYSINSYGGNKKY